jgi:hypothetical protein
MSADNAAPCRHAGAPPRAVIDQVSQLIRSLAAEEAILRHHGVTATEFTEALPAAIESMRGSASASNSDRRRFLTEIFEAMLKRDLLVGLDEPSYGDDTVYRLRTRDSGDIAVIQKGCPDGAHSSTRWTRPEWASETYLWWLCSSLNYEPGEHVAKGVNRLRQRFFSDLPGNLDGIIFHNALCGTPQRSCPKAALSVSINGRSTPPPCIYVMPDADQHDGDWNWQGSRHRAFPEILLALFGITPDKVPAYTGYVGFRRGPRTELRTTITARFGPTRATTHRS